MRDINIVNVLSGEAVNVNGRTVLGRQFPMGMGWYKLNLRFNLAVTVGTGTGAIAEGELLIVKNILLKTDRGETLVNLPGRALYKIAAIKTGSPPRKSAIAAATATYNVELPIYFTDPTMFRAVDTILDTARYNSITLDITMGGVADLFTTVGTSTVAVTVDAEITQQNGLLPPEALPLVYRTYDMVPPVDASNRTSIDVERSIDLAIARMYVHCSASSSAGTPFGGTNADDVMNVVSLSDQARFIMQNRLYPMIQSENKNVYALETALAGITVYDFVEDGSINSALVTGVLAKLQLSWSNLAGVAANDIVTLAYEGVRKLR